MFFHLMAEELAGGEAKQFAIRLYSPDPLSPLLGPTQVWGVKGSKERVEGGSKESS